MANNGGPTQTLALLAGSPAIDAGFNALALDPNGNSLITDQRGFARIANGTVDIGSYEFGASAIPAIPALMLSTSTLALPATTYGTVGAVTAFLVTGSSLTDDTGVMLNAPAGSEISLSLLSGFAPSLTLEADAGGTLAATIIYTRISAAAVAGTVSGNLTVVDSVTDNLTKNVAASGQVAKITPVVTWATPASIAHGTALSVTQLDATANVPGIFNYIPAAGTVLSVGANQNLSAFFTPTDTTDYTTAIGSAQITVTPAAPTPLISVTGDGLPIPDGESAPSTNTATDFGSFVQGGTAVVEIYTINNSGPGTLIITGNITAPSGYHVTQPQSPSIASGSSTTFAVTLPNSTANTFSGNVNIPTNDPANNPYTFAITGTVTGQVPTMLFISQQPADTAPGQTMPVVDVEVEDQFGHLVTSANSDITLAIAMGPDGATLAGTTTVASVNGVATFSDLSLPIQGTYTLAASDGNLTAATSNSFTVARPATQLAIFQQPASTTTASLLGSIVIDVEDSDGNLVAGNNSNVTLAIASGPGKARSPERLPWRQSTAWRHSVICR